MLDTLSLDALGRRARAAGRRLAALSTESKNAALLAVADALERHADAILAANAEDMDDARAGGTADALLDRLLLTPERLAGLARDTRRVADLPDPVGRRYDERTLPNGLRLHKRRLPLGVVGVIYEARPNVTVDVAALCLKAGNAVVLRGGSETLRSNRALVAALRDGLEATDVPADAVAFIDDPDRALVRALLRLDEFVDVIIPRGGAGLHRLCREEGTIPVITGGIGICHLYVDATADLDRALDVVENAKVQRPSVCNALDTLLLHPDVADGFLPRLATRLASHGVELRADERARAALEDTDHGARVLPAGPDDWDQEWLGLVLGLRVVDGLEAAVDHIHAHSTEHSDGILTRDDANAERFVRAVSSAAVYVNASTRFTDGGEFGLGAEVAVSTQKLHARGPMGLEELTTYGWVAEGDMHVRT